MSECSKVKSINVNSVFDKKTVKANLDRPLFTVYGVARSTIVHDGKYGEQVGFKGDFFAVNQLTGEIFESAAAFLPKTFSKSLLTMLEKSEFKEVKFNVTIAATESKMNDKGYAWVCDEPETEYRASVREEIRKEMLKDAQKLLAAPAKKTKAA